MYTASLPLSVIVVGSGISGLTCALALARYGHKVTVLERDPALRIGQGAYRLNWHSMRLLEALGLRPDLEKYARLSPGLRFRRYNSGEVLHHSETCEDGSFVSMLIERQAAGYVLYRNALAAGVQVRFGQTVVGVEDYIPAVKLEDSSTLEADLIVGADGANSRIRPCILYKQVDRISVSDHTFYNLCVPEKKMEMHPDLSDLYHDPCGNWWIGPGAYAVGAAIKSRFHLSIALWDTETSEIDETRYQNTDLESVRQRLANFDPSLKTMLQEVDTAECWRVVDIPHLASWRSKLGRIVLIGDAAHAVGPHAGMGVAMGIEDAFSLAEIVSRLKSYDQVRRATRLFEKFRKPRVETIVRYSRKTGMRLTLPDGPQQQARDRDFQHQHHHHHHHSTTTTTTTAAAATNNIAEPHQPNDIRTAYPDPKAPSHFKDSLEWLYDYDTIEQVVIFLAKEAPF